MVVKVGRFGFQTRHMFRWKPRVWKHVRVMSWLGLLWWW